MTTSSAKRQSLPPTLNAHALAQIKKIHIAFPAVCLVVAGSALIQYLVIRPGEIASVVLVVAHSIRLTIGGTVTAGMTKGIKTIVDGLLVASNILKPQHPLCGDSMVARAAEEIPIIWI